MSGGAGRGSERIPFRFRLLQWPYPAGFRAEFRDDLYAFAWNQRRETRYAGAWGAVRFWMHASGDAVRGGVRVRVDAMRERARERRGKSERGAAGSGSGGASAGGGGGGLGGVDGFARDLRMSIRSLARSPLFSLVFILTLGLGIGANTAIVSAVNGVLISDLPHEDGDRLVYLRHSAELIDVENALFSVPTIIDYREGVTAFEGVAEFSALDFTMIRGDEPERVRSGIVTGNYFEVIGLRPAVGRLIGSEDDGENVPAVGVYTWDYWQSNLGGSMDAIGQTVRMNGRTMTMIGVLEPSPPYPEQTDIYVNMAASPHHLDASMNHERDHRMTEVFAKLAPGATIEQARAEIDAVTERVHAEYPEFFDPGAGYTVTATPLKEQLTARARLSFLILLATGAFVLVIACANLANLMLSRFIERQHEFAVRASLGGSKGALRRQLLAESLVLSLAGAALGLLLATFSLDVIVAYAGRFTSRASEIRLDATVYGFALLVGTAASLFFAWVPRLPHGTRLGGALSGSGSRSTGGTRDKALQRGLVTAQVGVSFVLLVGAGLLIRTMSELSSVDPGFDGERVLTMDISNPSENPSTFYDTYSSILREVRELPTVRSAALANSIPLSGGIFNFKLEIDIEGFEPVPGQPIPTAKFRVVTPEYFTTLGTEVLDGREFEETDEPGSAPVVVVNQAFVDRFFPEQRPLGRQLTLTDGTFRFLGVRDQTPSVVGVVEDTRDSSLEEDGEPTFYMPYSQVQWVTSIVVRSDQDPSMLATPIREIIRDHNPMMAVDNVATLQQLGDASVAPKRLNTVLLGGFALLALVIAAVGIGGVLAFNVGRRTREFGIRAAFGADAAQVRSGVLGEGAWLAGGGVLLGVVGALGMTRFLSGLLYGVPSTDPVTYVVVGVLLIAVAIGASWLPAWRASRVSPMEALRAE